MPPGSTVPPEEARSQRRGLRSLVGSCGRVGPPVQVGQRTRSECRGVLKVVVEVSAIRARLATASIVGSAIGVHHSLICNFFAEISRKLLFFQTDFLRKI